MNSTTFKQIIQDIELRMESEGYFIFIHMHNGTTVEGGWRFLPGSLETVIIIDDNAAPPFYIPLQSIQFIQLSDR